MRVKKTVTLGITVFALLLEKVFFQLPAKI